LATEIAHIGAMSPSKTKLAKTGRSSVKAGATYRGVKVQATRGRTRFTLDQIKKAVEAAVVKNADALARKA
jgi:hypothetical protein